MTMLVSRCRNRYRQWATRHSPTRDQASKRDAGELGLFPVLAGGLIIGLLVAAAIAWLFLTFTVNREVKTAGQSAIEVSVKRVSARGSLGEPAMNAFVTEYLYKSGLKNTAGTGGTLVETNPSDLPNDPQARKAALNRPNFIRVLGQKTGPYDTCRWVYVTDPVSGAVSKKKAPYMVITLDDRRRDGGISTGQITFTSEGGNKVTPKTPADLAKLNNPNNNTRYTTITANIYESINHLGLGVWFRTEDQKLNPGTSAASTPRECQTITTSVSGTAFLSDRDLVETTPSPTP